MTYSDTLYAFAAYAFAINLAGFLAMAWNKESAQNKIWPLPQRLLLALALVGGAIGIIAGLRILRHNTGKDAFRIYLRMIVIVQFTVLLALTIPSVRNAVSAFLP